ncbi:leucine-rich repeat and immunoglobulin-like domain-containing nogo receptor-interacting protein 2 isoform X2 [Artemia franciscana]|uniref:leucine-rich repeat and immunoglobulin-like domain-containing nogo receptor-interacting protein 2 isoform X2 n=1 Tax=Artemia franciscana TaxID=6661 RepID=UPI0032DB4BAB
MDIKRCPFLQFVLLSALLSVISATVCPAESLISPFCSCYQKSNNLPDLICENFENSDQLKNVFNQSFPNNDFNSIILEFSNLPSLPADAFNEKTFKRINIERTNIKSIHRYAFRGSKDTLQVLAAIGNEKLESFPLDGLWGFEKLEAIIFSVMSIDTIRSLPSLPSLKKIAVQQLPNMKVLTQFPYLPNLATLRVIDTGVETIESRILENLPSLRKFEFDENNIKVMKKGFFEFHSKIEEISFEGNGIEEVEEGSITGNPLECFCAVKWLISDASLKSALYEAKCAGKTDLDTLPESFLDQIC